MLKEYKENLIANILTSIRIVCAVLILIFPAFSKGYYLLYVIGGFTDAIDGTVSRKFGKETDFGAKYDTIADFVFFIVVIIKLVNALYFPLWLLIWICVILAIKIVNLALGYIRYKQFISVHSVLNKICGAVLFIPPLFMGGDYAWQAKAIVLIFTCLVATIAAIDESVKVINKNNTEVRK